MGHAGDLDGLHPRTQLHLPSCHVLPCRFLMDGSKYFERMAREAIVRSDKAQRREDTGTK